MTVRQQIERNAKLNDQSAVQLLTLLERWSKVEETLLEWDDNKGHYHSFDHFEWEAFVNSLTPDDFVALSNEIG